MTIAAQDVELIQIIDRPDEVVEAIFKHYERIGFVQRPEEREKLLNLRAQSTRTISGYPVCAAFSSPRFSGCRRGASAQTAGTPATPESKPPALMPLTIPLNPRSRFRQRDGEIVEEYRVNGRLYKVKITPCAASRII